MHDGNSTTPDGQGDKSARAGAEPGAVHVLVEAGRTRIVLSGEIDADLTADLAQATADAESTGLAIDVDAAHVTFMDSSGIAFLARLASRVDQPVRVVRARESVRFLLEVTRMGELLEVVPEGDEDAEPVATAPGEGLPTIGPRGRVRPEPPDVIA